MSLERLIADRPNLHAWAATEKPTSWAVPTDVLRYMASHLKPGMKTLETGAGHSTVVFAIAGVDHTCVTPAGTEAKAIVKYLTSIGVESSRIRFLLEPSDVALPAAGNEPLDFAFIDGAHRFPLPCIDFHYIEARIKVGGILGVDDCMMPSVKVLCDFLDGEDEWQRIDTVGGTAFYKRLAETRIVSDWQGQKMNRKVLQASPLRRVLARVRRAFRVA